MILWYSYRFLLCRSINKKKKKAHILSITRTQVQLFAELDFCGVSKKNCIFLNIFHKDFSTKFFVFIWVIFCVIHYLKKTKQFKTVLLFASLCYYEIISNILRVFLQFSKPELYILIYLICNGDMMMVTVSLTVKVTTRMFTFCFPSQNKIKTKVVSIFNVLFLVLFIILHRVQCCKKNVIQVKISC